MGMVEQIDAFGVPEFYSDRLGEVEDAGNGMVRTVRCIERHGVLVPVFSCITPAIAILKDGPRYKQLCLKIMGMGLAAH